MGHNQAKDKTFQTTWHFIWIIGAQSRFNLAIGMIKMTSFYFILIFFILALHCDKLIIEIESEMMSDKLSTWHWAVSVNKVWLVTGLLTWSEQLAEFFIWGLGIKLYYSTLLSNNNKLFYWKLVSLTRSL